MEHKSIPPIQFSVTLSFPNRKGKNQNTLYFSLVQIQLSYFHRLALLVFTYISIYEKLIFQPNVVKQHLDVYLNPFNAMIWLKLYTATNAKHIFEDCKLFVIK